MNNNKWIKPLYICGSCGCLTASTIEIKGAPAMCGDCWEIHEWWLTHESLGAMENQSKHK